MKKQKLILLFGMPRSGTTWVAKLFDSLPDVYYLHEPDSVHPHHHIPLITQHNNFSALQLEQAIAQWLQSGDEKVIASRPFFSKNYINTLQHLVFISSAYLAKITSRLGLNLCRKPIRLQSSPQVRVWKSIESLGRMVSIQQQTQADTVQILRHPCGHIASTFRGQQGQQFDSSRPIYEDWPLFEKLLAESAEQRFTLPQLKKMYPEERLAVRWGILNDAALALADKNDSQSQHLVLVYEDLCRAPEEKLQKVFKQLGLSYAAQSADFVKQSTKAEDSGYYATTKTPLLAAYKWKKQLSEAQIKRIFNITNQFNSGRYYKADS